MALTSHGTSIIASNTWTALRRYGPRAAFFFLASNLRRRSGTLRRSTHQLTLKGLQHPLHLREYSDPFFFGQIFLEEEFAPLRALDISSVIDLGGNAGMASVWFLNTFPRARVVTVEANPDNFPSLEANLHPYGDRSIVVKGGAWWRQTPLALVRRRDEGDASVREALPGDDPATLMDGWDVPALMARAGFDRVDLLKIDIEGAETDLLLNNADRWLPRVRNLSIEFHGPECVAALERALEPYTWQKQVLGELTFCTNLRPKRTSAAPAAAGFAKSSE
ncbi:MAG TPA: FkbM family methyltransferase [Acidobacteriaceae bacterium]|jgi:FkbM family methyltransferase